MTSTYEKIATTTLGSSQANVTFSSIPATYTDLVLISNVKLTTSGGEYIAYQLNSNTSVVYSSTYLYGTGSSALSGRVFDEASGRFGNGGTGDFEVNITNFNNYSNSTTYKTVISRSNVVGSYTLCYISLWRDTSAINSIKLFPASANWASGSTFTLYGIKAE
jgi:hypothetical protein